MFLFLLSCYWWQSPPKLTETMNISDILSPHWKKVFRCKDKSTWSIITGLVSFKLLSGLTYLSNNGNEWRRGLIIDCFTLKTASTCWTTSGKVATYFLQECIVPCFKRPTDNENTAECKSTQHKQHPHAAPRQKVCNYSLIRWYYVQVIIKKCDETQPSNQLTPA